MKITTLIYNEKGIGISCNCSRNCFFFCKLEINSEFEIQISGLHISVIMLQGWRHRGAGAMPPSPPTIVENVTVLAILEYLEFKSFSCYPTMVAGNTFQCFMAPPL